MDNCKWLNKTFGDGYWICNGLLKPTSAEICETCTEKCIEKCTEKTAEGETK